jgi:hypothetical protein
MSNWMELEDSKETYNRYLASREWAVKKQRVKRRANGICERCKINPMHHVHHLTYARKYCEDLEDLQAICEKCHEFIHALSDDDPAEVHSLMIPAIRSWIPQLDVALGGGIGRGEIVVCGCRPRHDIAWLVSRFAFAFGQQGMVGYFEGVCLDAVDLIREMASGEQSLLVIDYRRKNELFAKQCNSEISQVSEVLRSIALDYGTAIIILCEMNSAIESRSQFIPMRSDVDHIGPLWGSADMVLFSVTPSIVDIRLSRDTRQVFIGKATNRKSTRAATQFDLPDHF